MYLKYYSFFFFLLKNIIGDFSVTHLLKSCLLFILVVCLLIISNVYSQFQLTYFYQVENVPWKDFMTSIPVWAIIVAHVTENWGWYTLLTQLPTYLKTILNFDLQAVCCFYYFINPFLFMIIYIY